MRKTLLVPLAATALVGSLAAPASAGTTCTALGCASGGIYVVRADCDGFYDPVTGVPSRFWCSVGFAGDYAGSAPLAAWVSYEVEVDYALPEWPPGPDGSCAPVFPATGCGGDFTANTSLPIDIAGCDEVTVGATLEVTTMAGPLVAARHAASASVLLDPVPDC